MDKVKSVRLSKEELEYDRVEEYFKNSIIIINIIVIDNLCSSATSMFCSHTVFFLLFLQSIAVTIFIGVVTILIGVFFGIWKFRAKGEACCDPHAVLQFVMTDNTQNEEFCFINDFCRS